ncbi:PAS domain-containing protein [Gilvimarinus agarilyticus]|uniref:PAS domain-containing protein n=1 Tax=Gilvimarinus agarilyticus TaxID=679259 RepID=UPI0005A0A0EC|nr:PAS domain-containing protein [Gilvimarinus agarilyticus]
MWLDFFRQDFLPLGHNLHWQPALVWTQVAADTLLGLSFFIIAIGLLVFRRKRTDLRYPRLITLFSVFILLCGFNHCYRVYTVWIGSFGTHAILSGLTALVAFATAIGLLWIMPKALKIPSMRQLRQAMEAANNEKLERLELKARYDAEYNLRESANASPIGLMVIDSHGRISMANSASSDLFGYSPRELVGQTIDTVIDFNAASDTREALVTFFSPDIAVPTHLPECVAQGIHRSGNKIPVELKLVKREHTAGNQVYASVTDISERLAQQQQLQAINSRLERISSATHEGLWEWQVESGSLWWSPAFWQLLGYPREPSDISMSLWEAHIEPDHQAMFFTELERHITSGGVFDIEFLGVTVSRDLRWFRAHGKCVTCATSGAQLMCGTLEDIQQRKDMELSLSEKNQLLESIYTGTSYGVCVLDCTSDGQVLYKSINPAIAKALGVRPDELEGKSVLALAPDIMPVAIAEQVESRYQRCRQTGRPMSYIESFPIHGKPTWWKTSLYPLMNDLGEIYRIIGSSADVSDLKAAESKLAESESFLQTVVDLAICGLYIYDLSSETNTFVNQQYTKLTGYTKDDLNAIDDISSLFHPDEIDSINAQVEKALTLSGPSFLEMEYRFWHKDGYWIWCYAFDAVYERDERGRPKQLLGTFIDITQIKHYSEQLRSINEKHKKPALSDLDYQEI